MIGLAIPEDQEQSFRDDYAAWCLREGLMNMLVDGTSRQDHVGHNPNATTNTSNPIKAWVMVVFFQDISGTFAKFLAAYPRWDKHKE